MFCAFVRAILGFAVDVDTVHAEHRYASRVAGVDLVHDLFAEDKLRRLIVEMQNGQARTFFDRYGYYHFVGLVEQVAGHQDYGFDRVVYTIVILTEPEREPDLEFAQATLDIAS